MLEQPRPGQPAVLGDMADHHHRGCGMPGRAAELGRLDQGRGAGPALRHPPGLALDAGEGEQLDGIDQDQGVLAAADGAGDRGGV